MSRRFIETNAGVHLVNTEQQGGEFTLCGDAFDIDGIEGRSTTWRKTTRSIVTCPRCLKVVLMCRGVRIQGDRP